MKLFKPIFLSFPVLASFATMASTEKHPSLVDVEIGKPFPHVKTLEFIDRNHPMTQFRAPNYGQSTALFPEYSVSFLNETTHVAIVTAEIATESLNDCNTKKEKVFSWAKGKFPDHKPVPRDQSQLDSNDEYANPSVNTYFVLNCYRPSSPFWVLHFQLRGRAEDPQVKEAWANFFKN